MRREHASEVTRVNIFTHNGAPQALVGCLDPNRSALNRDGGFRHGRSVLFQMAEVRRSAVCSRVFSAYGRSPRSVTDGP